MAPRKSPQKAARRSQNPRDPLAVLTVIDRLEVGHRRDRSGLSYLDSDRVELRGGLVLLELVGHQPPWALGSAAELLALIDKDTDAFNAITQREDQLTQARFLLGQWQEIYEQSAGKGRVGNAIGGLIFQWSDGWWKFRQEERLDIHDTNASWPNALNPMRCPIS